MKPKTKKIIRIVLTILLLAVLWYAQNNQVAQPSQTPAPAVQTQQGSLTVADATEDSQKPESGESAQQSLDENGQYTKKDDVALYLHLYGRLPENFVTKSEARQAGWEGGSLEKYFPDCSIGGDKFGNREGLLPEAKGRQYYECDIDTMGAPERGAKRIVYSNDGLVYYTDDHYESFTLLYGEA